MESMRIYANMFDVNPCEPQPVKKWILNPKKKKKHPSIYDFPIDAWKCTHAACGTIQWLMYKACHTSYQVNRLPASHSHAAVLVTATQTRCTNPKSQVTADLAHLIFSSARDGGFLWWHWDAERILQVRSMDFYSSQQADDVLRFPWSFWSDCFSRNGPTMDLTQVLNQFSWSVGQRYILPSPQSQVFVWPFKWWVNCKMFSGRSVLFFSKNSPT